MELCNNQLSMTTLKFGILLMAFGTVIAHIQPDIRNGKVQSKGVNLGGWLVVEHWMTQSSIIWEGVPDYVHSQGEYHLMQYLGHEQGDARFEKHRQEWIQESDIAELASYGINTVRVPIGYWIAGFDPTGGSEWKVFAPGALKYLDRLIKDWAVKYNVAVLISIHAAKGSQNGMDHSAPPTPGTSYWSHYPENVRNTVDLAVFFANRYRNEIAFLGIGLLNEPSASTDEGTLKDYYLTAIKEIRATGNDCVLTHAPLLYNQDPWHFQDFALGQKNLWHEWHRYLIWGYEDYDENRILYEAVDGVTDGIKAWTGNKLFIGEWSIATGGKAPFSDDNKLKQLAERFTASISTAKAGWTYWAWRICFDENDRNAWSLRQMIRKGIFVVK